MDSEVLPKPLLSRLSTAADEIGKQSDFRVISHYDADGISAAGVVCNTLLRGGNRFQTSLLKSLEASMIKDLGTQGCGVMILCDMGSSCLRELEEVGPKVIVLDHHKPLGDSERVIHINPHLVGIDGMTGASASAMAMLLAITVDQANWDLLPVAFAGIVGDRQHIRGVSGVNAYLLQEGQSRKLVDIRPGSLLPEGRVKEGLVKSVDPYIIGLSGDEGGVKALLAEAGVGEDAMLADLSDTQRRRLSSLVALQLAKHGCAAPGMEELITDRYYFPSWKMYADDLAQLLNACGRTDQEGEGLALVLGDRRARETAQKLREEYQRAILEGMSLVLQKGVQKKDHIQYFYNDRPSLSGVLSGLIMQFIGDCDKPTIALAEAQDKMRVSSRGNFRMLEKGVDLAEALRQAAQAVGGVGGGHAVASGATLPEGKETEFLSKLDEIVGAQKRKKAAEADQVKAA
jgi:single-stranded-DNA-specific exonuclease